MDGRKDDGGGSIHERIFERDGIFDREAELLSPVPVEKMPVATVDDAMKATTRRAPAKQKGK